MNNILRLSGQLPPKTLTTNTSKKNIKSDKSDINKRHKSQESSLINQENKLNSMNVNNQVRNVQKIPIDKVMMIKNLISPNKSLMKSNTNSINSIKGVFNVNNIYNKNNGCKLNSNDQQNSKQLIINKVNGNAKKILYPFRERKMTGNYGGSSSNTLENECYTPVYVNTEENQENQVDTEDNSKYYIKRC